MFRPRCCALVRALGWNFRRPLCCVAALVAVICVAPDGRGAERGQGKYKPGDRVYVRRFDDWIPGIVTEIVNDQGWARVKTKDERYGGLFTPADMRPAKPKQKEAPETTADPFATPEERAAKAEPRTWSDASGKFKVEATLLRVEGEQVHLRRADGKEISVGRGRLCEADQEYLAEFLGETESEDDPDDTFDRSDAAFLNEARDSNMDEATPDLNLVAADSRAAKIIDQKHTDVWNYDPDLGPVAEDRPFQMAMRTESRAMERVLNLLVSGDGERAIVTTDVMSAGRRRRLIRVCDLASRGAKRVEFDADRVPLALSPSGGRLAASNGVFGFGRDRNVHIYRLADGVAAYQFSFAPSGETETHWTDVTMAHWIDDERLFTFVQNGRLILWRVTDKAEAVYSLQLSPSSRPSFTPSNKYLLAPVGDGVLILRPETGERVAHLALRDALGAAALRADGLRLALWGQGRMRVVNLETKKVTRDFALAGNYDGVAGSWVDERRLVVGGNLVDAELRIYLEELASSPEFPVTVFGSLQWTVDGGFAGSDFVLSARHAVSEATAERASKLNADDLLVVGPGKEVSVDVQVAGPERGIVEEALKKRLLDAGMKVVPGAKIRLVASIRGEKSEQVEYENLTTGKRSTHTITQQVLSLSYIVSGREVWSYAQHSHHIPRGVVSLQEGETVDSVLTRDMRMNPRTFLGLYVPVYVAFPPGDQRKVPSTPPPPPRLPGLRGIPGFPELPGFPGLDDA